jgi:DNA ligase (NAD+)
LKYDGIGEIMQNNLLNFDYNDLRFDETVKTFLKIKEKEENNNENKLENKVFCITGKTHIFKNRADLTADIESKGGKVVSSMSSKVHYLINNDATSSSAKNKAAKSAGIPILTEEDYLAL